MPPALPLSRLHIGAYRGLSGLSLEEFGRINLFVGPNNSGKTSVLEALSLFSRPLDLENWMSTPWRREIKSSRVPLADALKWMFPQGSDEASDAGQIMLDGDGTFPGLRLAADYSEEREVVIGVDEPSGDTIGEDQPVRRTMKLSVLSRFFEFVGKEHAKVKNELRLDAKIKEDSRLTYSAKTKGPALPIAVMDAVTHRVESTVQDLYSAALRSEGVEQDLKNDFVRVLQKIDPGVQRLDLVQTGRVATRLQIKHARTGVTPLSVFGDGIRRALMIAVTIPTIRGGVLLIDELEAALHVRVLDSVMDLLHWAAEEFDVQVFATTHSLEAVDAVARSLRRQSVDLVGYRLEQDKRGITARRIPGDLLHEMRFEQGLEIR